MGLSEWFVSYPWLVSLSLQKPSIVRNSVHPLGWDSCPLWKWLETHRGFSVLGDPLCGDFQFAFPFKATKRGAVKK